MPWKILTPDQLVEKSEMEKADIQRRMEAEIASVRQKYAPLLHDIEGFQRRLREYAYVPPEASSAPRILDADRSHTAQAVPIDPGRLGPVSMAIMSIRDLGKGMTTQEIIAWLKDNRADLGISTTSDAKPVYNALTGLQQTGRVTRDTGEDGKYYAVIKRPEAPPTAQAGPRAS